MKQFWMRLVLLVLAASCRAEDSCLRWAMHSNVPINKRQAERSHQEALRWLKHRLNLGGQDLKSCINVHVGQECPDTKIEGPCGNPVTGDIYMPEWGPLSAATIVQCTITTGLLRLLSPAEISKAAMQLFMEDSADDLDHYAH